MSTKPSPTVGRMKSKRNRANGRRFMPTCASAWKTNRSTSSASPRRTTGTRWPRSGRCRTAKTSTSKSRSATTSAEGRRIVEAARKYNKIVPDRHAKPLQHRHAGSHRVHPRRRHRRSQARPRPVLQAARLHRPQGELRRSGQRRLRPLVRPGPHDHRHPAPLPLRLALAVGLRQRRPRQPGHPPDGHRPLGPGRIEPRQRRSAATAAASATKTPAKPPTRRSAFTTSDDKRWSSKSAG